MKPAYCPARLFAGDSGKWRRWGEAVLRGLVLAVLVGAAGLVSAQAAAASNPASVAAPDTVSATVDQEPEASDSQPSHPETEQTAPGPAPASASVKEPVPRIVGIEVIGNRRTRARIIEQEMTLHVGDLATPAQIERSRRAIMDLGLFESVDTRLLPAPGGVIMQIEVNEKIYVLPIPRLDRNADGDITQGLDLRFDNLAGLNQRLKLSYKHKKYAALDVVQKQASVDYSYPRMLGSAYRIDASFERSTIPESTVNQSELAISAEEYQHRSIYGRIMVSRLLQRTGPSLGWSIGGGVVWRQEKTTALQGAAVPSGTTGNAYGVLFSLSYYGVHDLLYSRRGVSYGYDLDIGGAFTASDYAYARHTFYYRRYQPLGDVANRNLNLNLQLGLSAGKLFGAQAYALGGSSSLRGYESGFTSGAAYVLANVEYLTPIFGQRSLRLALFTDVGNTYPSNRAIDLTDLRLGGGIGLRWRVKSFVNVNLRLDVAYGDAAVSPEIYAGTRAPF